MTITIRPAEPEDCAGLCTLLNEIIGIGGTTAYEALLSDDEFADRFINGPRVVSCHVAAAPDGALAGFQVLKTNTKLPPDWLDIATFARARPKVPGIGRALFPISEQAAKTQGCVAINATIRADNTGGLAYYDKIGFVTYKVDKAVPLSDGTPVDRVSKKYLL